MARPTRQARRRALAVLAASATAFAGAALLGPGTSSASSHREAPYIAGDPAVDNTDTFVFTSPDDQNSVTMIANWAPFSEPAGGPNFQPWDSTAAYDINIDNNGDAKPDITYRWTFKDIDKRGQGAGSFLYANGPVTTLTDDNLLFRQTYDLTVIRPGQADQVIATDVPVAPSNVGIATIPDYVTLRKQAVKSIAVPSGTAKTYAGQADDPFFLDLRVFDLLYGANLSQVGYDTLSGYNVNTIAYQVPKAAVAANGDASANPVIGVWSTTSRHKNRTFLDNNAAPATSVSNSSDAATHSGDFVQISRLGNPLVNELVVPANLKDFYNRSTPDTDAKFLPKVQDPEVPQLIEGIYKIPNPNKTAAGKNRPDLAAVFLTGISKKQSASNGISKGSPAVDLNSLDLNAVSPNPAPAEYLRLNMAVKADPSKYSQLGVIGGDVAGYPNGRRLNDDVTDITLQAAEGILVPDQDPAVKKAVSGLGDGVSSNDRPFLSVFPYIADPHTGSDPRVGQTQVKFDQTFTSNNGQVTANVKNISPAQPGGYVQLYRVMPDGSIQGLGQQPLNKEGTATPVDKVFPVKAGTQMTLNYRVFTPRVSAAQTNRGVPTTFTVR